VTARARVLTATGIAAALAAALSVAVAVGQRGPTGSAPDPAASLPKGAPPLAINLGLRSDPEAKALNQALRLYDQSLDLDEKRPADAAALRTRAAALLADHTSLEARIARAFAAWPMDTVDSLERLAGLHAGSAVVQLHLGIARLWSGRAGSDDALHEAADLAPDTPVAVTAGNLLFPEYARDLPRFVPGEPGPAVIEGRDATAQIASLKALWRAGDRLGGLYYGVALQRLGRPLSARRAFSAVALRYPDDPAAQTAAAVARFDKENPSAAFGRLGPLSRRFPRAATVRFHLGVMLLWSKQVKEARRQLGLAISAEPRSAIAAEARRYVDALRRAGA
jgi:tetratricopeptide (TPR) repeat protein